MSMIFNFIIFMSYLKKSGKPYRLQNRMVMTRVMKVSGIKRHIAVDAQGLPHVIEWCHRQRRRLSAL